MSVEEGLEGKGRTIEEYKEQIKRDEQQKKLLEIVEALGKKIEIMEERQGKYCDPTSGQCFVTQLALENFLKEQAKKIPQILGGHSDLSGLFRSLAKDGNEHGQDEAVQSRIPATLKARWVKKWCKDGECRTLLKKEGFVIEDGHKHSGAFPGS